MESFDGKTSCMRIDNKSCHGGVNVCFDERQIMKMDKDSCFYRGKNVIILQKYIDILRILW